MAKDKTGDANIRVVGVCGNEATVYGPQVNNRREFVARYSFPTRGAALEFASDYEDRERGARDRRASVSRAEAA